MFIEEPPTGIKVRAVDGAVLVGSGFLVWVFFGLFQTRECGGVTRGGRLYTFGFAGGGCLVGGQGDFIYGGRVGARLAVLACKRAVRL